MRPAGTIRPGMHSGVRKLVSIDRGKLRIKASHTVFTATVLVAAFLFFAGAVTAILQDMFPSQASGSVSAARFAPAPQFPAKPPIVTQFTPDLPRRMHVTFAMSGQVTHIYIAPKPKPKPKIVAPVPPPPPPPPVLSTGGGDVGGAFGACVRAAESGGNYQVWNASGHYGAYQFSESTWIAYGGPAADFGHASPAEQDQVFMNALARGGQSNWSPYDGC